jgi:cyclophilin family peptidyl-prolyl cis-trans isomerase
LVTDYGTIVFRLSDETPLHRNNFIRLVNGGFYDSLLFHRVVNTFLIQTGDPESKAASGGNNLGDVDLPYTIPAEFTAGLFHKRGAVNAARNDNPQRASSSTQFTIIQGRVYNDSTLSIAENRINGWLAGNRVVNDPANKVWFDLQEELANREEQSDSLELVREMIKSLIDADLATSKRYEIPEAHRQVYKTVGGAAHLDQNYTVFGEVITGMEVVDSIARVQTNRGERPVEDVRIVTARMIRRSDYK